jgi:hypothetical protein
MSALRTLRFGSNPPKREAGRPNNVIAGFKGSWETLEKLKKYCAIVERR